MKNKGKARERTRPRMGKRGGFAWRERKKLAPFLHLAAFRQPPDLARRFPSTRLYAAIVAKKRNARCSPSSSLGKAAMIASRPRIGSGQRVPRPRLALPSHLRPLEFASLPAAKTRFPPLRRCRTDMKSVSSASTRQRAEGKAPVGALNPSRFSNKFRSICQTLFLCSLFDDTSIAAEFVDDSFFLSRPLATKNAPMFALFEREKFGSLHMPGASSSSTGTSGNASRHAASSAFAAGGGACNCFSAMLCFPDVLFAPLDQ